MLLIETEIVRATKSDDGSVSNPHSLPAVFDADTGLCYVDVDGQTAVLIDGKTAITFNEPLEAIMRKLISENDKEQDNE